jgi:chemotaxis protein CheC
MIIFSDEEKKEFVLTNDQIDVLMELGNIGSGNAIVALSKLLNKKIEMSLTYVNLIPFWELPNLIEDPATEVFGINSRISNHSNLSILQFFSKDSALSLINLLNEEEKAPIKEISKIEDLDDLSLSIITETGNILAGNYANALANLMCMKFIPDVPFVSLDLIGAIIGCIAAKYTQAIDHSVIIDTKLEIEDNNLNGVFCFIPDYNVLRKLFQSLNVECLF